MGKPGPEASKNARKRQLNVIYFIDSARTRTLSISLGQLKLLLAGAFGLVLWSISSVALVAWLVRGQANLTQRLHGALSAIFEYETRDDKVFDIAYPPTSKTAEPVARVEPAPKSMVPLPVKTVEEAANPRVDPALVSDEDLERMGGDQDELSPEASRGKASLLKPETASEKTAADNAVVIGHPKVEMQATKLDLHFDLTSKSSTGLVEGYIYAVAEFTTDTGEHLFIGAPGEIQVSPSGVPGEPKKAASFAIRRFKQKHFTFPIVKGKAGMFTRVHIAVLDRSGSSRSAIDLPVQIRIGKSGGSESAPVPKPG